MPRETEVTWKWEFRALEYHTSFCAPQIISWVPSCRSDAALRSAPGWGAESAGQGLGGPLQKKKPHHPLGITTTPLQPVPFRDGCGKSHQSESLQPACSSPPVLWLAAYRGHTIPLDDKEGAFLLARHWAVSILVVLTLSQTSYCADCSCEVSEHSCVSTSPAFSLCPADSQTTVLLLFISDSEILESLAALYSDSSWYLSTLLKVSIFPAKQVSVLKKHIFTRIPLGVTVENQSPAKILNRKLSNKPWNIH